jgi:hypothetical protein
MRGLEDGISPENVELIFGEQIADVVETLERRVAEYLSGGTSRLGNVVV